LVRGNRTVGRTWHDTSSRIPESILSASLLSQMREEDGLYPSLSVNTDTSRLARAWVDNRPLGTNPILVPKRVRILSR
jgi:hypothetical protein